MRANNQTEVTTYSSVKPGGNIPNWMANLQAWRQALILDNFNKYLEDPDSFRKAAKRKERSLAQAPHFWPFYVRTSEKLEMPAADHVAKTENLRCTGKNWVNGPKVLMGLSVKGFQDEHSPKRVMSELLGVTMLHTTEEEHCAICHSGGADRKNGESTELSCAVCSNPEKHSIDVLSNKLLAAMKQQKSSSKLLRGNKKEQHAGDNNSNNAEAIAKDLCGAIHFNWKLSGAPKHWGPRKA